MSFDPNRDGHYIWDHMHLMAANATTPEKRALYVQMINNYKICFPCEVCRKNLVDKLEGNAEKKIVAFPVEPYSNTNVSLFYHSWKLHDKVNEALNKPIHQRLTYDQAFDKWFPAESPHATDNAVETQRVMVSTGNHTPVPTQCKSCGSRVVQNSKVDYAEFRKQQKRGFLPKNN